MMDLIREGGHRARDHRMGGGGGCYGGVSKAEAGGDDAPEARCMEVYGRRLR